MELPKNFVEYDYIIEIIREFIDRDYLKTKKSQLKWYCINIFNTSPYTSRFDVCDHDQYLTNQYYDGHRTYYDVDTCFLTKKDEYTMEYLEEPSELTEKDVFDLLRYVNPKILLEVLISMIFPPCSDIEILIEKQYQKNIYPLDTSLLLEFASFKFVNQFKTNFINKPLLKIDDIDFVIIKNNINDIIIKIPKILFDLYCGISLSINEYKENIITVPFEFSEKSSSFLLKCLKNSKLDGFDDNFQLEFKEFTKLLSFLQISFS